MAQIRADEISRVLRAEIENYDAAVNVSETGSVISVGDGIARVYGLETRWPASWWTSVTTWLGWR